MDCFKKEEVPPEQTEYEKTYTERELLVIQRKFAEQAIRRYQDRIVKIDSQLRALDSKEECNECVIPNNRRVCGVCQRIKASNL